MNELTPLIPLSLPKVDGVFGIASDIVKAPPELRPAVDLLLGQTLIVTDRSVAHSVLRGQPLTTRAVTLRGEVFYASGPISVGQIGGTSTISRQRQSREFYARISKVEGQISSIDDEILSISKKINGLHIEDEKLSLILNNAVLHEKAAADSLNQLTLELDRVRRQNQWQLDQREILVAEIKSGETEVLKITNLESDLADEIAKAQRQLEEKRLFSAGLNFNELQDSVTYWNTQVAVTEQALASAVIQQQERMNSFDELNQTIEQLVKQLSDFDLSLVDLGTKKKDLRLQESDVVGKIEALRELIEPVEIQLEEAEGEQDELQKIEGKAREGLSVSYRQYSQAQLSLTRKQELLENLRERIENDLGLVAFEYEDDISGPTPLPLGEMVEKLPRVSKLPEDLEKTIKRQRAQVRRMGAINPDAQVEYKEVKNRFEFMTAQVDDLHKAEKDVNEVIAELEALMEREFRKTFNNVAMEFREIFTRLFGGGSAQLVLTDPDNLTETGIDIEARLPGRRSQGLSLLSGGERSLTATALVFSLLKVSPTPFCVLDEVDAMLDEANVGRFRELLRELAENTQFIVITHNRNTVQAADVIYGVTMGSDSASQVISLKLDEVSAVV
jgi:chromosome segregation protein